MSSRLFSYKQVCARTAQSRAGLWRLIKAGKFPRPVDLGTGRRVGFVESEVQEWINARPRISYGGREAA